MGILDKAKAALQVASGELDALRERQDAMDSHIGDLQAKISALRNGPLRLEDFRGYIAKFVEERGEAFGVGLGLGAASSGWAIPDYANGGGTTVSMFSRGMSHFEDEQGNLRQGAIVFPSQMAQDKPGQVFDAMCFFCPEAVISKLSAGAETKLADSTALPVEERRKQITQLEQELRSAEAEQNNVTNSIGELSRMLRT